MVLSMQPTMDDEAAQAAAAAAATEGVAGVQQAPGPGDAAPLQTHSGGRRIDRQMTGQRLDNGPADPMFGSPFVAMSWGTGAMIASMPPTVGRGVGPACGL
jgi:hypothetical protein